MKISVIIPVYNAEKYIKRCISSVEVQTYSDWEIIAINDGSTDNSLNILKQLSNNNSKVKVYNQENRGAGFARNRGIELAKGEYIVFLDADDIIEKHYFQILAQKEADLVFIDVKRKNIDTGKCVSEKMSTLKSMPKDDILRGQMTGKILWGGVRKVVKRELIKNNSIKFSGHTVGEEAIYSFLVLYYAKSIDFIDSDVYTYCVHSDSLSQKLLHDPWGDVALNLIDVVKKMGIYDLYANTLNAFLITATIVSLDKLAQNYSLKKYRTLSKNQIHKMKYRINSKYKVDYKHMDIKVRLMSPFVLNDLSDVIYVVSRLRRVL